MIAVDVEQLLDEHRQIDDRSVDLLRMTRGPTLDLPAIRAGLQDLDRMIKAHIAHEDPVIYDVMYHLRAIGSDQHAVEMRSEVQKLRGDWAEYFRIWTETDFTNDIPSFQRQIQQLLARIRDRVRVESELLYFTALRHGLLTLRLEGAHSTRIDL